MRCKALAQDTTFWVKISEAITITELVIMRFRFAERFVEIFRSDRWLSLNEIFPKFYTELDRLFRRYLDFLTLFFGHLFKLSISRNSLQLQRFYCVFL